MKTQIIMITLATMLLISCNNSKQAKLEGLKAKYTEIATQIKQLEEDIAKESGKPLTKNAIQVNMKEAQLQVFNHYIEVQGKVDGEDNVGVSAKTIGVVNEIFVTEGQTVKEGQVLAQLDDKVLKQSLEEVKTQYALASNLYNKQKNLWDQKIGSEVQFLSAKTNKEALEKRLQTTSEQIEMSKIKSPINGTIEEIPIKIGQSVAPGLPIFRVVNFAKIKVMADVSETYAPKINKGDDVVLFFPDINKEVTTKVSFASKYINPVNRTFQVEIKLSGKEMNFKANMICVVKVNDYNVSKAMVLPMNVIQTLNNEKYVFVMNSKNGVMVAQKQLVKLGQSYNGNVEILEGIKENDKIIVSGFQDLEDGVPVKL